ncbi:hypothetical protein I8935_02705 [Campylobacter coli]|uniref:Uncharacterized protein n=8 Tax=Campylobacter coli TaxID=195 RepID=A0A1B3XBZ1_CAMCO|nr:MULTISPECIES: hypothetical protein [Campylobacter]EAI7421664.1 hypothetical protein [Campylobacter hyointestinalis]EAK5660707.1 hypothetical protein [Campylobacter fetus]EIA58592.1 hypothetical protein cco117_00415 [Campylobacter coli 2698]EIA71635.1 hypothetical protein cco4_04169 [Campylobacter coli 7--1]EIA75574.1 hypothetical protein cco54_01736 [Campylobacter coli 1891]EIB06055.1 hypothetical protein cco91_05631 [Campylobacter coli H6]KDA37662.1 hypothetical protein N218_19100 [Campy
MTINSANPYQNLALSNPLQNSQALNLIKDKKGSNLEENENNLENLNYIFNTTSYASEFSFRIDEKGFFEKDLNKIANIPESYNINIKSVRNIAKELTRQDATLNYNKIDLPYLLNSYYSSLKSVNLEFSENDNANLSRDMISKFATGFSTENGEFLGKISRIYNNQEELNSALNKTLSLNTLMLDNKITNFHFDRALNNTSSNEILKPYLTKNAEVSKSGLLMNFIYHDIKTQNDNELNFFMKPASLDLNAHTNFQKILRGEMDIKDYIKQQNEQKMSFDLYLYVNGVDKKTASQDKLSVFFQQYVNYQKDMDLREFANSSSIFQIYIDENHSEFNSLKEEYQSQNKDLEKLDNANNMRSSSIENFLDRRQKQANLNKILNSYLSVLL